jgi:membrane protein involved in colicin uptake
VQIDRQENKERPTPQENNKGATQTDRQENKERPTPQENNKGATQTDRQENKERPTPQENNKRATPTAQKENKKRPTPHANSKPATQTDQKRENPTAAKNKNKKTEGGTLFAANTPSGESIRASMSIHVYGADIQRRIARDPHARSGPQHTCTTHETDTHPTPLTMSRKSSTNQRRFFSYDA